MAIAEGLEFREALSVFAVAEYLRQARYLLDESMTLLSPDEPAAGAANVHECRALATTLEATGLAHRSPSPSAASCADAQAAAAAPLR